MGALRRLAKACFVEAKRQACFRGWKPVRFETEALGRFGFVCANRTEYYRTVQFGGEAEVLSAFLFLLRADDVVWDVGASVGLFTVHAGSVARRVVAFEPDPMTFGRLRQNVALNHLDGKVECVQRAVGAEWGRVRLSTDGLDGNAPALTDLRRHVGSVEVEVETVDRLIRGGLPRPTVVKVDVEGAEEQVLQGAAGLLCSNLPPRILFIEVHPRFLPEFGSSSAGVESAVESAGYRVVVRRPRDDQYHILALHGHSDEAQA